MDDFAYADFATLQGQLQRGRGIGARRAPTIAGAAEMVYECVIADSRWDRQTEQRDAYLARLIHRLDLPLAPIEHHLSSENDADAIETALRVLALLPLVGRADAAGVIRRYAVEGRHWSAAVEAIDLTGSPAFPQVWAGLDQDVVDAHDDAELAAHAGVWEPWTTWGRTQPRLRRLLDEIRVPGRSARPPLPDYTGAGTAQLAGYVTTTTGRERRLVLEELGRRGEVILLDLAEDPSLRNPAGWTPGMARALHQFGAAAVTRARTWVGSGDDALQDLAVGVLSRFGDRGDAPYLLTTLTTLLDAGAWCAAETPARGLGRLHIPSATAPLIHAWQTTPHSMAREAFLAGIQGCAPDAAPQYAEEGLDDCEPSVQQTACTTVPDTTYVHARLAELSQDPLTPDSHEAAHYGLTRLSQGSRPVVAALRDFGVRDQVVDLNIFQSLDVVGGRTWPSRALTCSST
ncbi:hypothetical protein ACRYCC_27585 [Actinomadura scrupuli]|uniref:hypothetical protein n=1 Tax=Actinomadura scrupuli TaxID=559629 RepID=UPI003D95C720